MGSSHKKRNGKQLVESLERTLMHGTNKTRKGLNHILNKSRKIWPSYMCISLALFFFDAFIINNCYVNINFHCKPTKPIEKCTLPLLTMYIYIIINVQEESAMKVNTTELRRHLSDYLAMANKEEIIITNKGIEIARIISPKQAKKRLLNNLVGILPSLTDEEIENIKNERISKR